MDVIVLAKYVPNPSGTPEIGEDFRLRREGVEGSLDPGDEYGLSDLAKHFIAGQLAHARGMSALLAPLVNSYKRLVPGFEAPVYVSWARVNRGLPARRTSSWWKRRSAAIVSSVGRSPRASLARIVATAESSAARLPASAA